MPLPGYGLLIGKIVGSRPQRARSPHWVLFVRPGDPKHPDYRVAVNFQPTDKGKAPELQYQIVDFPADSKLIRKLKSLGTAPNFLEAVAEPSIPRLDYVRGGFLEPRKFKDLPPGSPLLQNAFARAVAQATKGDGALIAVFGTGTPIDADSLRAPPTGFTGVENLHMNQGARNLVGQAPHYRENGPDQDGGIIFLLPDGARGFFVKFRTQTLDTRPDGHAANTGIAEIDSVPERVRKIIAPEPRHRLMAMASHIAAKSKSTRGKKTAKAAPQSPPPQPSGTTNTSGYFFADVDPNDATAPFIPDDDSNTFQTPYVMTRSKGTTKGPVPTPRAYPTMQLSDVVGASPPGYTKSAAGETIAFDIAGDSGATNEKNFDAYEAKVTDLIARDAKIAAPAFLFHVGDVVYFYGEENYYYSQFYEPFRAYPAPIFAIPGNHDGITYDDQHVSLDSFQKAFCAEAPGRWEGAGGILRSTMTQPGVYFTLDAPCVSIIGLYSNCGESLGWLDAPQLQFLYKELVRLKALRKQQFRAVLLAIHHFPRWMASQKPKDPTSAAIDRACEQAGFWPDAVICGHAHLNQRVVRQQSGQDIPYMIIGGSGYGINPLQEEAKTYMKQIAPEGSKLGVVIDKAGYCRASVNIPASGDPTLRFEIRTIQPASSGPDDVCQINLRTRTLI